MLLLKSRGMQKKSKQNLLDLIPLRNVEWKEDEQSGRVYLICPKFINPLAVRLLTPLLKKTTYTIKLDEIGSFVWLASDGQTPVSEIAQRLKKKFGEKVEPVYERTAKFIQMLLREKYIILHERGSTGTESF